MDISRRRFTQRLAASAALSLAAGRPGDGDAAENRYAGLILSAGPDGRFDEAKIGGPSVLWNEDAGAYWMYYYGRPRSFPKDVAPAFGTGSVGLATSKDGLSWSKLDGPLPGGAVFAPADDDAAFDSQHVGTGQVIRHNGEWIMCYFGGDSTVPTELGGTPVHEGYRYKGYRCRPGLARSKDGLAWTRVTGAGAGGAAIDMGDNIYGAFPALLHDGERFLLFYTTLAPDVFYWDTKIAASDDLSSWTSLGSLQWRGGAQIWERGGMVSRSIMRNPLRRGKRWLMTYTALDAAVAPSIRKIGIAESDDALIWTQLYDAPVFFPAEVNQWDGGGTAYGQLIEANDGFRLYYYGFAHPLNKQDGPLRGIGLAVSEGRDLRRFRRL